MMKQVNATFDIVKFIGSILIFSLHCDVFMDYPRLDFLLEMLSRWGVPFFFICSSYFLFSNSVNGKIEKASIVKYTRRIAMLYLVWLIYNLPNVIYKRLYGHDLLDVGTYLVFLKNSVLYSTFTGSWYLASSIFSAWAVYLLGKKFKTAAVMKITSLLYIVCALSSAYGGLLPEWGRGVLNFLCFPRNIFNGCFYFAIGKYISENRNRLTEKFRPVAACCGFAACYLLFFAEVCIAKQWGAFKSTDVAFSTVFVAFFLFMLCLNVRIETKHGLLLRKCSTIIYCCHGNVLLANGFMKQIFGIDPIVSYYISACGVAMICFAVFYIQKYMTWKWTKYLT